MIKVNKGFYTDEVENYAKAASHLLDERKDLVDCSLGVNPYGISPKVLEHLREFNIDHINLYPESNVTLKNILLDYWKENIILNESQVHFAHGAMGAVELINKILLNEKSKVLGYCPQFTDYIFDVEKCSATFDYVPLRDENNYAFDLEMFKRSITEDVDVVYLDNPNNPTGQILPISAVEEIVAKAGENNCAVIVDEAYGDYMDDSNSAAVLVNTYDNLFVVRSFSKAFGMAGLRVGYVIMSKPLSRYFEKVQIAFPINSLGQFFTHYILDDRAFIIDCVSKIKESNRKIKEHVKMLRILETSDEVPITTLMHPDENVNLFELFLAEGILTNSCSSYVNLGKNSVRLRVPKDIEPVLKAIDVIEIRYSQA
jgi:histidinol-phosphate aminotransferase